jgi:uncharacterized membrane protein
MFPARIRAKITTLSTVSILTLAAAGALAAPPPAFADDMSSASVQRLTGLWLTTKYPEFSAQAGKDVKLDLALSNKGLPPQRVELGVDGLPDSWHWEIEGGGHKVGAATAQPDETADLSLMVTPPADAKGKTVSFKVTAKTGTQTLELPLSLTLTAAEPAKLTIEPKLPALRGTAKSAFDFQATVKNEGQEDTVVNLLAKAPDGFETTFKEGYGSQELTSLPLKAGESKDLKISVRPPSDAEAGQYPVAVRVANEKISADVKLVMDITGWPELALSGPEGRLSGDATAGSERTFNFTIENTGSSPAQDVAFSASPPSGWKVTFNPEKIPDLAPHGNAEVAVNITPTDKAIAGDYVVPVRANGGGASDSASFRVTVRTSTLWGVAGLGVIAAAVMVLGGAVTRYGRR